MKTNPSVAPPRTRKSPSSAPRCPASPRWLASPPAKLRGITIDLTGGRYATIRVGDQDCSTNTLKDATNAVWNHCCSFDTVLDTTAVNVVIKDQDDVGEDDLIGVACTSVNTGSRWLDLIRQGALWVSGAVKLQLVFELVDVASPNAAAPSTLLAAASWRSVNGTGGTNAAARCPAGWFVADCTCKAHGNDPNECTGLRYGASSSSGFDANAQACSAEGATAQTVLGA